MWRFSGGTEFLLVMTAGFWWAIAFNFGAVSAAVLGARPPQVMLDDGRLLTLIVIETIGLLLVSLIGYARGWSLLALGISPGWRAADSFSGLTVLLESNSRTNAPRNRCRFLSGGNSDGVPGLIIRRTSNRYSSHRRYNEVMKNFLIIVLSLGLAVAAFLTRPDREEFERYVRERNTNSKGNALAAILSEKAVNDALDKVEFKDFYLWTVVKKDGKTLYTGVFDRWIDNERLKDSLPS